MRIFTNNKLIRRYSRIGQYSSIGGLVILLAGLVISFTRPEMASLSLIALVIGFILSQIGIGVSNRYVRPPRPDQALNQALKGLDRRHTLYHYIAPTAHLLTGPTGMWVLVPKPQRGRITFEKGRWRQRGGVGLAYMKLFAQETIGRPDLEIGGEVDSIVKFLKKHLPDLEFPAPQAALLFTNDKAEVDAPDAPVPTMPVKYFKEYLRKSGKERTARLSPQQLDALQTLLEADITPAEEEEG